ncbi:unnamed protein product [Polarella glacialis]|uniref:Cytochrome b5 heme-binding domain-containing protein n=1 Tax=Polarella glacialis TaxID=89957 RepID=A0A813E3U0_POLGL|nr:unnamed protein product [Polarella glacialis]
MSLSAEEVAKHASKTDCWVVVGEEVLDVTEFMEDHPGGSKAIMMFAGRDATEEFDMLHERKVIKKYGIDEGTVVVKGTFKKYHEWPKPMFVACGPASELLAPASELLAEQTKVAFGWSNWHVGPKGMTHGMQSSGGRFGEVRKGTKRHESAELKQDTIRIARKLPADEVAKHASKTDCWVVVGEEVLDVTEFMEDHPGGSKAIMMFAGRDATEEFDMLHERKVIKKYGIDEGTVVVKGTFKK